VKVAVPWVASVTLAGFGVGPLLFGVTAQLLFYAQLPPLCHNNPKNLYALTPKRVLCGTILPIQWLDGHRVMESPMSYAEEFETVDLLVQSSAETRGVDAFALTLIKAERQIRKLFTYLVFQFPFLSVTDIASFRDTLAQNRNVYFNGFVRGIDALSPRSVEDLVGVEYPTLYAEIQQAIKYRNKIFHGQLTDQYLSRKDLLEIVTSIRKWCEGLARHAEAEFGYDGFARNSLHKSVIPIWQRYKLSISTLPEYRDFIQRYMER
jgi:hypothetical protein